MAYCTVGDETFHYSDVGDGPPLVLLHPAPLDHTVWLYQQLGLGHKYRLIALDQRCFGRSPKTRGPIPIEVYGSDLNNFLEAMNISAAMIVGVSLGGIAAQLAALADPRRLRGLILVSTTSVAADVSVVAERRRRFAHDGLSYYPEAVASLFGTKFRRSPEASMWISYLAERSSLLDLGSLADFYESLATLRIDKELDSIHVPTLVIAGEDDETATPSKMIADAIEGSEYVIVPEAGRLVNVEQPRLFNELVDGFVTAHEF